MACDAWQLLLEQKVLTDGIDRCFPYNSKSVGATLRRGRNHINADDLRHEVTSRLFESGLPFERVTLVNGHKDW